MLNLLSKTRRLLLSCCLLALPAVQAGEVGLVGIDTASLANPFFKAIVRGVLHAAKAHDPTVEVITLQHEYDSQREESNLRHLMAQRVRLLIVSSTGSARIEKLLAQARQAGTVVIAVDVLAPGAQATVMTDNRQAGEIACHYLAEAMQGKGQLAIQGGPQVSSVIERIQGCKAALARYPGIELLATELDGRASPTGGQAATQALLKQHPNVAGIFTINDRQALGSDSALRAAGRRDVLIASVDGSPAFAEALPRSDNLLASATQDPFKMAKRAVEIGVAMLEGRPAPSTPVLIAPGLLTRDNLAQYQGWLVGP